ncbi:hypothetical protein BH11ACT3_BH11ACT3_13720 [soil metagenome]
MPHRSTYRSVRSSASAAPTRSSFVPPAQEHDETDQLPDLRWGFRGTSRAGLAIGAALICFGVVVVTDLPAGAVSVKKDAYVAQSQTLAIGSVPEYSNNRDAFVITQYTPVRWPLSPSTEVSSGFGYRIAPCYGCSSDHQGVDFDPGEGTPIDVIADGTVVESTLEGGLGQHVIVQHVIDGQLVQSVYGHMIAGSQTVGVGDSVVRGQVLGLVGSTGASTGAHLHFEIRPDGGAAVEPLSWLAANVTEPWG